MCPGILIPTPRRLLLFFIFLVLTVSGIMAIVPPFQNLFGFPYLLLSGYTAILVQVIYSYIVACIYAFAYVRLEASIRRSYPGMNSIVQKHAPPSSEPLVQPEPPASRPASKPHRKVHAAHGKKVARPPSGSESKKAVKRRKR